MDIAEIITVLLAAMSGMTVAVNTYTAIQTDNGLVATWGETPIKTCVAAMFAASSVINMELEPDDERPNVLVPKDSMGGSLVIFSQPGGLQDIPGYFDMKTTLAIKFKEKK